MLKNGKLKNKHWNLHADGCSCCNTKRERRVVKHSAKQREKREWKKRELN